MDVSVNEKSRLEFFYEPVVAFKALVTWIFLVVNMARRRVRQKDVEVCSVADTVYDKRGEQRQEFDEHLAIRVLIQAVVVAD